MKGIDWWWFRIFKVGIVDNLDGRGGEGKPVTVGRPRVDLVTLLKIYQDHPAYHGV